jgi:hypothetical protein
MKRPGVTQQGDGMKVIKRGFYEPVPVDNRHHVGRSISPRSEASPLPALNQPVVVAAMMFRWEQAQLRQNTAGSSCIVLATLFAPSGHGSSLLLRPYPQSPRWLMRI